MASPFPFTSGQVLTAAQLNGIGETTTFTPSWSAGFTPGNAVENWSYTRVQNMVIVNGGTTLGSTSSHTGTIDLTLPVGTTAVDENQPIGMLHYIIPGNDAAGPVRILTGSSCRFMVWSIGTSYVEPTNSGASVPATLTNGDQLLVSFAYILS